MSGANADGQGGDQTRGEYRDDLRALWAISADDQSKAKLAGFKSDSHRIRGLQVDLTAEMPCTASSIADHRYALDTPDIIHLLIRIAESTPPEVYHGELSGIEYETARALHESLTTGPDPLREQLDLDIHTEERVIANLKDAGYESIADLRKATTEELCAIPQIGPMAVKEISKNIEGMDEYRTREKVDLIEQRERDQDAADDSGSVEDQDGRPCPFCGASLPEEQYEVHLRRCEES